MAKEARINLTSAVVAEGNWTNIKFDDAAVDLLDFSDGSDIGWDFAYDNTFEGSTNLGVNAVGSGDADWVDRAVVSQKNHFASDDLTKISISGLDNAKTYTITVFGSHNSAQACQSWINGDTGNKLNHEPNANSTLVNAHSPYSPSAGVITINLGKAAGSNNTTSAIRIQEDDAAVSGVITGTTEPTALESEIVTGGETIIITLTGDTWVAAGATFDAQRQVIIDGLDSAQAEVTGWNAEIRDKEVVGAVVRTSDTVATITLSAAAAYKITTNETITVTIPAAALVISGSDVVATPPFVITNETPGGGGVTDGMVTYAVVAAALVTSGQVTGRSGIGFAAESGFSLSGTIIHGGSVTLTGTGFGAKAQAAPILWDMGSEVFIDGAENTAHAALNDGDNAIGPIYATGYDSVMSLNRPQRHIHVDRHYSASNFHGRSFLFPSNLSQFDGTNSARQIFTNFKIKWGFNPTFVDGVNFTNLVGNFIEGVDGELGEAITITYNSQNFAGNILNVGLGPSGYLATQLGVATTELNITSATTPFSIVGDVSGATADCETSSPYRALASGKLGRIDQKGGTIEGVQGIVQVSNKQFWIESNLNNVDEIGMNRFTYAIDHDDVSNYEGWSHVETLIDFRVGTAIAAQHRAAGNLASITSDIPGQDGSTNILNQWIESFMFGYDASPEHAIAIDYGELYVDSTPQRVVIGDNATYSACKELEMQRPTAWGDTSISFVLNEGALVSFVNRYLYTLDIENNATLVGQFI